MQILSVQGGHRLHEGKGIRFTVQRTDAQHLADVSWWLCPDVRQWISTKVVITIWQLVAQITGKVELKPIPRSNFHSSTYHWNKTYYSAPQLWYSYKSLTTMVFLCRTVFGCLIQVCRKCLCGQLILIKVTEQNQTCITLLAYLRTVLIFWLGRVSK